MPVRVPLPFAKPTMRLAKPLCDAEGRLVAGSGTALTDAVVRTFRKLAIQTVLVADGDDVASWERTRPLSDDLLELERRIDREPNSEALGILRAAITRHLCKRALRVDRESRCADHTDGSSGVGEG
jgi:hypothetical protein